jgi:hypothetical protein
MNESSIEMPPFHPKQKIFYKSEGTNILWGGDTRGGKSFGARKSLILWCGQIPGLICDIFRLNWDDVIKNNMVGEHSFPSLLAQWVRDKLVDITETSVRFWNGSRIDLKHCADDKVMLKHQGNPSHVRWIEEAGQIPERRIRSLMGWMTMTEDMKKRIPPQWRDKFPKIIHTTNFLGPGMIYYRREFLEGREPYKLYPSGAFVKVFIPAYLDDNPSEDKQKTIDRIKETFTDPAIQSALLESNWRAPIGEFFPEWNEDRHVLANFLPPNHWFRFRTFDWGTAEPFAVYWWAVSDGQVFKDSENVNRWFPRGALIAYNEWYGCDPQQRSKGLRLRNEEIAEGIIKRSEVGFTNSITLTDSLPFQDRGGDTIAQIFNRCGCPLSLGDTSRVPGWSMMRSRLIGAQLDSNSTHRFPMIYFTASCEAARDYIPALTRHPSEAKKEDAAEHGEATHSCDAIRLACTAHTVIKDMSIPSQVMINAAVKSKNTMKTLFNDSGIFK